MARATIGFMGAALAMVLVAGTASAAATPQQKCQAAKSKLVARYASCRLLAQQQLALVGDTAKYDARISKCESKFAASWQKAVDKATAAAATCFDAPLTETDFKAAIDTWTDDTATALATGALPGCVCASNAVESCYSGPVGTVDIGVCTAGTQTCNATGSAWGSCTGEVIPSPEVCGDGLDNDCTGVVDQNCTCAHGSTESCYSGPVGTDDVGVCTAGTRTCNATGTGWGTCVGEVAPSTEVCGDGLDNDCDGVVDQLCPDLMSDPANCGSYGNNCYAGATHSQWTCVSGSCQFAGCDAGYYDNGGAGDIQGDFQCQYACFFVSAQEDCNFQDDNCNGQIDENLVKPSVEQCGVSPSASTPECAAYNGFTNPGGIDLVCSGGSWKCQFPSGVCTSGCGSTAERCDGLDNNCNGSVDEGADLCALQGESGTCQNGDCLH